MNQHRQPKTDMTELKLMNLGLALLKMSTVAAAAWGFGVLGSDRAKDGTSSLYYERIEAALPCNYTVGYILDDNLAVNHAIKCVGLCQMPDIKFALRYLPTPAQRGIWLHNTSGIKKPPANP